MANEQRAVVGDSATVRPVPLVLFWTCLTTRKEKESLLRLVHPETKLAVANEQRAVVGDSPAVGPVPL